MAFNGFSPSVYYFQTPAASVQPGAFAAPKPKQYQQMYGQAQPVYPQVFPQPSQTYQSVVNTNVPSMSYYQPYYLPPLGNLQPMAKGYPGAQTINGGYVADAIQRMRAESVKEQGNKFRDLQMLFDAVKSYESAIDIDPTYVDAYYNLGQTWTAVGDPRRAVTAFENLLKIAPNDFEARILLGEQLASMGQVAKAKGHYQYILTQQPSYDPAARNLGYLILQESFVKEPLALYPKLQEQGVKTMAAAKALLKTYYRSHDQPFRESILSQFDYVFEPTQRVAGISNLAEYDAERRQIRFQPEMAYSNPAVVAAYAAHELTHGLDGDALTSVLEEQAGYRALAKFWLGYRGSVIDPNLDRAVRLYQESPDRLDQEVRELYTLRDPMMSEKSPGHGMPYLSNVYQAQLYDYESKLEMQLKKAQLDYDRLKKTV